MSRTVEKHCFVPVGEFDINRLIIESPVRNSFKRGNSEIEWWTSPVYYTNGKGEKCKLMMEFPKQFTFGINSNYPMGCAEEDKTADKRNGLQICYPLTSLDTVNNPTDDEQYTIDTFDKLWNAVWKKMEEEAEKDEPTIPDPSCNAYLGAQKRNKPEYAIKPIATFPRVPKTSPLAQNGKRPFDKTKPKRTYVKLMTKGSGTKLRCDTQIFGPGNKLDKTGLKFEDVKGYVHPVFYIQGIYWGSHGQTSYGASLTIRVAQMNFEPKESAAPMVQLLPPNNAAPIDEDDNSDEEPETKEKDTTTEEDIVIEESAVDEFSLDEPSEPEPKPKKKKKPVAGKKKKRATKAE